MGKPDGHSTTKASERDVFKVASVAATATSIEYYDFFIYGTASALVFPALFFPEQSPVTALLLSFAAFGIGFIARPLGGMIFGHFGDVVGRKKTLVAALVMMGVASTVVGLMPTYSSIGLAAPILLVALRFIQGIALGGQGGIILLAVEAAPAPRRGFFGSFSSLGAPGGVLLANLAFLTITALLPNDALLAWAWRVPFLLSLGLVALAIYIHFKLEETPAFQRLQQSGTDAVTTKQAKPSVVRSPLVTVLRTYPKEIALTIGTYLGINLTYYIFITFVISYGTNPQYLDMPRSTLLAAVLIGSMGQIIGLPLAGALSDRFGRRRVQLYGAAALAVFVFPFWAMVDTRSFWLITLGLLIGLGFLHSLLYGVQPTFFAEIFSTEVRFSGVSLGIQIGSVLGGAFAPLVATALLARYGSISIALYMSAACLLTLLSLWLLKETHPSTRQAPSPAAEVRPSVLES
ncbi:MFS transporter [Rhodococcus artemisiae]|uniref:MFS transporter n=1 Tax=Rhodococcus artemisiae TaxID=714159 RepID=A0ABU7LM56_9NOCA|nr:MFS transporter [Rhodococcus artemisiae]MEE2062007.1 MFS transporter [Rhodococcus artemisiae]